MYRGKLSFVALVILMLVSIACTSCNTVAPVDTDIIDSGRNPIEKSGSENEPSNEDPAQTSGLEIPTHTSLTVPLEKLYSLIDWLSPVFLDSDCTYLTFETPSAYAWDSSKKELSFTDKNIVVTFSEKLHEVASDVEIQQWGDGFEELTGERLYAYERVERNTGIYSYTFRVLFKEVSVYASFSVETSCDEGVIKEYIAPVLNSLELVLKSELFRNATEKQETQREWTRYQLKEYGIDYMNYADWYTQAPLEAGIHVSLPAEWSQVGGIEGTGYPIEPFLFASVNRPKNFIVKSDRTFEYSCFEFDEVYYAPGVLLNYEILERDSLLHPWWPTQYDYWVEGTTDTGNAYLLLWNEIDVYHAVEYMALIQIEDYIVRFTFYADRDDLNLIYEILDSFIILPSMQSTTTEYTTESTEASSSESTANTTEPVTSGSNWSLTELPDSENLLFSRNLIVKHTLRWIARYNEDYAKAVVSMEIPENTVRDEAIGSLKYNDQIITLLCVYQLEKDEPLDTLIQNDIIPAYIPYYNEVELFTDNEKYYIQFFTGAFDSRYRCLVRISENYVLYFNVEGTDLDFTVIDLICDTASIIEVSPMLESQDLLKTDEPLETVRLKNLIWIEQPDSIPPYQTNGIGGWVQGDLPENVHIQIALPASWSELPGKDDSYNYYSEFSVVKAGISPERCMYQGFFGEYLFSTIYNTGSHTNEPFVCFPEGTPGVEEGITEDTGNNYWLRRVESPTYHAIEYDCYVQVSEAYIYHFMLCLDIDNADLVYDIMNSIQLSIGVE